MVETVGQGVKTGIYKETKGNAWDRAVALGTFRQAEYMKKKDALQILLPSHLRQNLKM